MLVSLCLGALVAVTGCAGIGSASARAPARALPADPAAVRASHAALVCAGMHKPQIRRLLGEPDEISAPPSATDADAREQWIYHFARATDYRVVVTEMEDVPYFDPITEELRIVKEPRPSQQRINRTDTLTLTFDGPRVVAVRRDSDRRSSFDR